MEYIETETGFWKYKLITAVAPKSFMVRLREIVSPNNRENMGKVPEKIAFEIGCGPLITRCYFHMN